MKILEVLHQKIIQCRKCKGLLRPEQNYPRPGFPPKKVFQIVIIGAEPGPSAKDPFDKTKYHHSFRPGSKNSNRVRLLFEELQIGGIDFESLYFTNAVKCPSTRAQSRKCFENCKDFLKEQIEIINPKLIVVLGRAAYKLQVPPAHQDSIEETKIFGCKAITIRHPQGSSIAYRKKATKKIISAINKITTQP